MVPKHMRFGFPVFAVVVPGTHFLERRGGGSSTIRASLENLVYLLL